MNLKRNEEIRKEFTNFKYKHFNARTLEIARRMNINYTMLSQWHSGTRNFSDDTLNKISKFIRNN